MTTAAIASSRVSIDPPNEPVTLSWQHLEAGLAGNRNRASGALGGGSAAIAVTCPGNNRGGTVLTHVQSQPVIPTWRTKAC